MCIYDIAQSFAKVYDQAPLKQLRLEIVIARAIQKKTTSTLSVLTR